jgi:hypothetical protein
MRYTRRDEEALAWMWKYAPIEMLWIKAKSYAMTYIPFFYGRVRHYSRYAQLGYLHVKRFVYRRTGWLLA